MSEFTTTEPAVFGQSMDFYLSFPINGYYKTPDSIVSFRVYENQPTEAEMTAKSGETGTAVTSWTQKADDPPVYLVTYGALTDSDPNSAAQYERYWFGVNFKWESGGAEVWQKKSFLVWRPQCIVAQMNVTYDEVAQRMGFVEHLGNGYEYVAGMVKDARESIIAELTSTNEYTLDKFHDLQRANLALKYKTLSMICIDYASSAADSDAWLEMYRHFDSQYDKYISIARVGIDKDGSGTWQPGERAEDTTSGPVLALR